MKKALFFCLLIWLVVGCHNTTNECARQPDIQPVEINIKHLEDKFLQVGSKQQLKQLMDENPIVKEVFLRPSDYPNDSVMIAVLYQKFTNPHMDTLLSEVKRVFGDGQTLKQEFENAFAHLKYYYPETHIPEIKTVSTALGYDLFVSDSLIIVGLDYYLGEGAKYRPLNMFNYMLKRYAPQYIVPSVMLLKGISPEINKTDLSEETILSDMISYGKAFYFAKHMMPCTPDSTLIWYDKAEIEGVRENADIIWAHFVQNELLFETDHMIKKKYIDPRPKTYEIGEKAPPRIGTWLGWQIVKSYMQRHEGTSLSQLMEIENSLELFNKAKYKPD